ncbi:cAMP-specific 3',5'-cyclic phosphodiesterase 4B isoform X2 [Arapaima gigas]
MSVREAASHELAAPDTDLCIRTFREHMHLELEPPKAAGKRSTSPKISPRSSPRLFRKMMVNKSIRQRRRFTVAHTCVSPAITGPVLSGPQRGRLSEEQPHKWHNKGNQAAEW